MDENCVIHSELKQGTDEWLKVRAGKCTSSEKGLTAGKVGFATYLIQKEAELFLEVFEEGYVSDAMQDGTELEPIARELFAEKYLLEVEEVGFVERADLNAGWSPDGLIRQDGKVVSAIEVKCRKTVGHYRVLKEGLDAPTYNQMQFAMAITGLEYMYFVGYNPDFVEDKRLHIIKIDRSKAVATSIIAALKFVKKEIGV